MDGEDSVVGRDEALQELRRVVTGREFEFATVLEVTDGADGFLLRVRSGQRLCPHTLVVAADERSLALDHSVGEPLHDDDAQLWAQGVVTWLAEQLDTGVPRWGQRITLPDGTSRSTRGWNPNRRAHGGSARSPWSGRHRRGSGGYDG